MRQFYLITDLTQTHTSPDRRVVFPRLIVSVTETALASGVFAERKDRELFSLLHQWRHTVNEFNRRLDITELRVFTNPLPQEINSLYEALQESKEFNDAVTLTRAIESIVSSQYPDKFKPFGALLSNVNRTT